MATLETKTNSAQHPAAAEQMSTGSQAADENKSKLVSGLPTTSVNGRSSASSSDGGLPSPQSPQSSVDLNKDPPPSATSLNLIKQEVDRKPQAAALSPLVAGLVGSRMPPLSSKPGSNNSSGNQASGPSVGTAAPSLEDKRINNNTSAYNAGGRLKFFKGKQPIPQGILILR